MIKGIAKKVLPRKLGRKLRSAAEFDNTYPWLNETFSRLMTDERCRPKPMYAWGVTQAAALAKVLGTPRISVIEFGVAGGFGLLTLEKVAAAVETITGVAIDVIGFDTGVGLPKPEDYRDQPNMWFEGQLPMDRGRLESALSRASLRLGPVKETVPIFIASNPSPVGFVSFDMDLYASTRDALILFKADYRHILPRVISYFDDICGHTYNDFCGERLAIKEFNDSSDMRKVCVAHGLRYFIPESESRALWPECVYYAHFFEHPLYRNLDSVNKGVIMDVHGTVIRRPPGSNWK